MDKNYGVAGATLAQTLNRPTPELGKLKAAAERIATITNQLDAFVSRFHGGEPDYGTADSGDVRTDCYRNDISVLFGAIDRLEATVSQLDPIG